MSAETGGDAYTSKQIHEHSPAEVCRRDCPAYGEMLAEKTAARLNVPQAQNDRGEWVPAIPEPLFLSFGRARCDCGVVRRGRLRYREHYALMHVMGMGS